MQPAENVLDDDDGTIHNQTEVDGAETHQVTGDLRLHHSYECNQHRQRNREGNDDASSEASQQKKQDCDDQHSSFNEIARDRMNCSTDQISSVIEWLNTHTFPQRLLNLGQT